MAPFPSYTETWHTSPYPSISPTKPTLSLAGKTAVITGGGTGIGLAISLALSHSDVSNQKQVNSAFTQIRADFGKPLDILVNNAGQFNGLREFGAETYEEWTTILGINIKGVYFVTAAFVGKAAEDATIINVSSAVAHLSVFPGFTSYASTKLAGSKIMEYVQQANPRMHVVDMHPGQIRETDMANKLVDMPEDHIDDVELPGHFAVWLASPEAKFLKGKFVWCNWDVDEMNAKATEIESTPVLAIGLNDFAAFK